MRAIFRNLCIAIFLLAAAALVEPYVESALYLARLTSMAAPATIDIPVAKVRAQSLRDSWHAPREAGRRRHEGIDIFAARGTPVLSATQGVVLRTGASKLGGNIVWVLGPGGQRHYYAHLDRFAGISSGMRNAPGTVLGYVGNSGNAAGTPPHLHYGIYTSAGAINPFPFLQPGK